jgi:hypothetical protein
MIASDNDKLGAVGHLGPRLVDALAAGRDDAGEDQRLGPRPAFGETLVDEELIGSPFRHGAC